MLIAANGHDPAAVLNQAVALGGLQDARDPAAVITWRLDLTQASGGRTRGPLPWLPGIPTQLLDNPDWKTYLSARYSLTRQLGQEVHAGARTADTKPGWAEHLPGLDSGLVADIQLWRAAHHIPDTDLEPTGPGRSTPADARHQRHLDRQLETAQAGIREWAPRIIQAAPAVAGDPRLPVLAAHLANLHNKHGDGDTLLHSAVSQGGLPDDHPADALRYRITALAKRRHEMPPAIWETVTPPPPRHRPEDHQPPRPSHGIGI